MRLATTACTLVVLLAGPALAAQSLWDAANGLPPDAIPSPFTLVDEADADPVLSAGVLTIATSADADRIFYIQSGASIDVPDPWVIEFEMRHVSGTSSTALRLPEQVFLTTSPDVGMLFQIGADSMFLMSDEATIGASATVDTDESFHTYRIEVAGTGAVDVYYDDVLTLQGLTYTSAPSHGSEPRVAFGAGSSESNGVSEWRSFAHNGLATSTAAQINVNIAGTGSNPMVPSETGGAPGVNDDNWNNLAGTPATGGPIDLVGGDGLPVPGATASWIGLGSMGALNDGCCLDDVHLRSTSYDAFAYPAVDVTVTGIPFSHYDVYAYHEGGAPSGLSRVARFTIGDEDRYARRPEDLAYAESTATSDAFSNTQVGNYVVFRGLTASSFTMTAGGASASDGTPRNRFFGFQVVESVPTTTTTSSTSTSSTTAPPATTTTTSSTSTTVPSTTTSSTSTSTSTSSTTAPPATTTTTLPPGTTLTLPGNKLLVKQKKSGSQRLQLLVKDPTVTAATPCEVDGELIIEAAGVGAPPLRVRLDASLWKPIKASKPEKGCTYRKGPVVATVQIKTGKSVKVVANASDLGVPLATDPRPVRIEVRHGDVRHCMEFGGAKARHKPDKKLLAKNAEPATRCPGGSPSGAFLD